MHSPRQLLRKEILHPRPPDQLRVRPREAKRVRQPRRLAPPPKAALEVALPVEELPHERLARRHVRVVLDPRAADEVERAVRDLGPDAREELGVELVQTRQIISNVYGEAGRTSSSHLNCCA